MRKKNMGHSFCFIQEMNVHLLELPFSNIVPREYEKEKEL